MPAQKLPMKHDNVRFHFINGSEDSDLTGTVVLRGQEMVLDIPGGYGPYLIVGAAVQQHFEGKNSHRGGNPVEARWAAVGGGFHVGVWYESDAEFLFSFEFGG